MAKKLRPRRSTSVTALPSNPSRRAPRIILDEECNGIKYYVVVIFVLVRIFECKTQATYVKGPPFTVRDL